MAVSLSEISPRDLRTQAQMDALLEQEGIRRDRNLDYSCGVFDDGELIACGSSFHNTLRCLAVSSEHRGEGLMNQVVSHLMERQVNLGNSHVFLYTKLKNERIFKDLGFYEIARVDGSLVFLENRRDGFARYLRSLEKTKREGQCAAVVMNANPFTLGHRYLIETAAKENAFVHLFLLREEAGPIPFAVRKMLVQAGVADLENVIFHESGPYIISSATFPSYFLRDEDEAILAHARLDLAVFAKIAAALNLSARYVGEEKSSHVTALYNRSMAELLPQMGLAFREIPRLQAAGEIVSASTVRQAIHDGRLEEYRQLLPQTTYDYFMSDAAAPVVAAIRAMPDPRHY